MQLQLLHSEGERLIDQDFVEGRTVRWPEDAYSDLLVDFHREVDLSALDDELREIIETVPAYSVDIDFKSAALIHQRLGLTRREAADPGVWRFLAVVFKPEFVRHRYEYNAVTGRSHFWVVGNRPRAEANVFFRLWWIAELSRMGADYSRTKTALQGKYAMFFKTRLAHSPAMLADVLERCGGMTASEVEEETKRLNRGASVVPVEGARERY